MARCRYARALRRRHGRSFDRDSRGRLYGQRALKDLVEEQGAQTIRAPRLSIAEQLEYDRREKQRRAHA